MHKPLESDIRLKPIVKSDNYLRSFGRVSGRKLRPDQMDLVENFLPKISIDIEKFKNPSDLFSDNKKEIWLEIGFGDGGHLAKQAELNPEIGFIGSEVFTNGVAGFLKKAKEKEIDNVRVFFGDARLLLDKLPKSSLDGVYILYPDPWPKSRHNKKRIISQELFRALGGAIKQDGRLIIASDHDDYKIWIKKHLEETEHFLKDCITEEAPEGWIKTKYQMKAEKIGQGSMFFSYVRK